jgi:uncharacterized protein
MSWGDPSTFGFLVLLGCLSGFVSGLLGVGGGTILVPALIAGLPLLGVNGPELPKIAMATSLALVVPTAVASAQTHASKDAVDWNLLGLLCPSIVAGSFVAGVFAKDLSTQLLCALFVGFALHAAWGLLQRHKVPPALGLQAGPRPGLIRITATGVLGGAFASLLGLGVAFFAVPVMTRFIALPRAIGTAAALCIPMALAGVAGQLLGGTPAECRESCAGHIYLPAVAAIGITAVLTAPMGARLTHVLPVILMRRLFALFLIAAAVQLTYKFVPLAAGVEQGRQILVGLMTPGAVALPNAAEAPSWLEISRRNEQLDLVARYGPRRAYLPLAQTGEDSAAGVFVLGSTSSFEDWRVKPAGTSALSEAAATEVSAPERPMVSPPMPEPGRRKVTAPAKRAKRAQPLARQVRRPLSPAHAPAQSPAVAQHTEPKPRRSVSSSQIPQSELSDPFAIFGSPGAGKPQDGSN